MSVPDFNTDGNLPAGVHLATWRDFVGRFAITRHRQKLVRGLKAAISILRFAGCLRVYVDGSFVTDERVPNDYDAAWDPAGVDVPLLLMAEPVFVDFGNQRAAQKAKFSGEFFPTSATAGLVGRTFLDFYQVDKETGNAKGIIALDLHGDIDD